MWAADVTYIPMACGFLYLVAIIDSASRAVLAWRLSNTNYASFSRRRWRRRFPVRKAADFQYRSGLHFHRRGFHRQAVTAAVVSSMDGRGRFMDNIFIEWLWR